MRLLACLIVAPQRGYDEPAILSYAISSFCPTSADGLHINISSILGFMHPRDQDNVARSIRHGNSWLHQWPRDEVAASFKVEQTKDVRHHLLGVYRPSRRTKPCPIHQSTSATPARKFSKAPDDRGAEDRGLELNRSNGQ